MDVQIYGLKKSAATRKAERFFKERRLKIQFFDLLERPLSKGEATRFAQKVGGLLELVDKESKIYAAMGFEHMRLSEERWLEHLQDHPDLLKLPLVRLGKNLGVGEDEAVWTKWLEQT